jgi:hypothetical protein
MPNGRKEAAKRLYEIAEGQQGFFTTKQAKAAGFAENNLTSAETDSGSYPAID